MRINHKAPPSARRKRRMIAALARERWRDVALLVLFLTLTGSFRSLGADYIQTITDHIQADGSRGLGGMIGIACAIQAVNYSTKFLAAYLCMSLTKRLALHIRLALIRHVESMPCALYEAHPIGDLQSIVHNDTDVAANYIYVLFSRIGTSVVTALFTFWFMARIDGPMTLAVLLVTVCFGAVNRRILQNIRKNEKISRKAIGDITESVVNGCETADTIRAYAAQDYWLRWFHRHRSTYNHARINIRIIDRSRMALYTLVNSLTLFGSAIYMAYRALSGVGTLGGVLAYITLLTQALISIEMIFRWMSSLVESDAAWDRVDSVLAEGEGETAEPAPAPDVERLELRHIGYRYPGGPRLFADRDFAFEKGHIYAIVGESGSGKSTLLKCILGLYPTDGGRIRLNGAPVQPQAVRGAFAFVPAENYLFTGSVYDNLTLGDAHITRSECMEWAEKLGMGEWLRALPGGLAAEIEKGGQNLSGGQRQMLCILRAVLSGRPILVLDEPFASLDAAHLGTLQRALTAMKPSRIVLLTSHRSDSTACCDQIFTL